MGVVRTGEDVPEICPRCRFLLRRDFNFCPACGERVRQVCTHCRAEVETGWAYCAVCGEPQVERGAEPLAEAALAGPDANTEAEAHNARGTDLYENDEFEEAVREFGAAVLLAPTNATYRTNLAVALSEMGDYERAIAEFREAIRLEPGHVGAYLQLGYTYQEMERPQQAVEAWRKVLEIAPGSPEAEEAREAMESI